MASAINTQILGVLTTGATINTGAAATIYSSVFTVKDATTWAVHLEWTGGTSTVTLQASCKPTPNEASDTDWVDDADITVAGPDGAAGKSLQEIGNSGASYYRLKVVTASGSGTISGWVNAKPGS